MPVIRKDEIKVASADTPLPVTPVDVIITSAEGRVSQKGNAMWAIQAEVVAPESLEIQDSQGHSKVIPLAGRRVFGNAMLDPSADWGLPAILAGLEKAQIPLSEFGAGDDAIDTDRPEVLIGKSMRMVIKADPEYATNPATGQPLTGGDGKPLILRMSNAPAIGINFFSSVIGPAEESQGTNPGGF